MIDRSVALLGLQESIVLNLITVNVDSVQEFPTRGEGPNQRSNHMTNGPKSTNSNVTQQSSVINGPERRGQPKIDGPESYAMDIQSDQSFKMQILSECPELFEGTIGLTNGEVSITLNDNTRTYQALIRRMVQPMVKPLKHELDRFLHEGILVKMDPDEPSY